MTDYYTGVGSRNTPKDVLCEIKEIATKLEIYGYHCRTGNAFGADKAFRDGTLDKTQFLSVYTPDDCNEKALKMGARFHPGWQYLSDFAKLLHARNGFQVLGPNLNDPSKLLVCWTPDGVEQGAKTSSKTGGTGQAIRIATAYKVPVFNLKNKDAQKRMMAFIQRSDFFK